MKRISLIILLSALAHTSAALPKSITASNIAAIASVCKEIAKTPYLNDTPAQGLLKGIWAGLAWYETAEKFGPSTRAAFSTRSPYSWLQVAHAASAASYMGTSLAKTFKKYRSDRRGDQDPNGSEKVQDQSDSEQPLKNQNENEFETTNFAKGLCATGVVLLATLKFPDVKNKLKDLVLGSAYSSILYSDAEYMGQRARRSWTNNQMTFDDVHALTATAFLTTTIAVTALKVLRSAHRDNSGNNSPIKL